MRLQGFLSGACPHWVRVAASGSLRFRSRTALSRAAPRTHRCGGPRPMGACTAGKSSNGTGQPEDVCGGMVDPLECADGKISDRGEKALALPRKVLDRN